MPSIRRYAILESTSVGVTVLERQGPDEAWTVTTLTNDGILGMPENGIEIRVAEFYEDVSISDEIAGGT